MSSLTFWREFSPVSVQSHAPVAILLSTAQCNVDVPIHSLCDHHDVMMLGGRNGISYKNLIAGKKRGSRDTRKLKTQLHLVSGDWTAQIRFPCFCGFSLPHFVLLGIRCSAEDYLLIPFNFLISKCLLAILAKVSSSHQVAPWSRLDKVNIQKLWAIVSYQDCQSLWTDDVLQI